MGLIWPDLIRDYDPPMLSPSSNISSCLIWPDLIRDYDAAASHRNQAHIKKCLIWPDLIRDYDEHPDIPFFPKISECLIWPDLIRDYDSQTWVVFCFDRSGRFDMTWLDKGLRPTLSNAPRGTVMRLCLIWPDLIRDYDWRRNSGQKVRCRKFDMTWLDKGLRPLMGA